MFSHDVTAAILVSQNNETAAMLVSQTNHVGVELFSYVNVFFCSNKFAYMLATWVKTLYILWKLAWKSDCKLDTDPQLKKIRQEGNAVSALSLNIQSIFNM